MGVLAVECVKGSLKDEGGERALMLRFKGFDLRGAMQHFSVAASVHHLVDVGCAELIISGRVKVKQGVELQRYLKDGVTFTDGSKLDADVVIYAWVPSSKPIQTRHQR